MQNNPGYGDLMGEIIAELRGSIELAERSGIARSQLAVDPGIGFAKTAQHNLEILNALGQLRSLGVAVLIGPSRKAFIGKVCGREVGERLWGTAATVALAAAGGADIVRVHDVRAMRDVVRMAEAVLESKAKGNG
jgi:dihydropteroate synthase